MENIDIETINKNQADCILELEGMIKTNIRINNFKIEETKEKIRIFNNKNKKEQVELLKYQIMKIEREKNTFVFKFDMLQSVKLIVI